MRYHRAPPYVVACALSGMCVNLSSSHDEIFVENSAYLFFYHSNKMNSKCRQSDFQTSEIGNLIYHK